MNTLAKRMCASLSSSSIRSRFNLGGAVAAMAKVGLTALALKLVLTR